MSVVEEGDGGPKPLAEYEAPGELEEHVPHAETAGNPKDEECPKHPHF